MGSRSGTSCAGSHPSPSPLVNGPPSHDRPGNILAALDPQAFQRCFIAWVSALQAGLNGVVAIDGKTLRRSRNRAAGKDPVHMISAFAAGRHPVCGQRQVDGTSNAITAIPELLDLLHIEGALATLVTLVTLDAMTPWGVTAPSPTELSTGADNMLWL